MTPPPAPQDRVWKLVQPDSYPFALVIVDSVGTEILRQDRYALSTEQKTLADCMNALGFEEPRATRIRALLSEQIEALGGIVTAVNSFDAHRAALSQAEKAMEAADLAMSLFREFDALSENGEPDAVYMDVSGKMIDAFNAYESARLALSAVRSALEVK